MSAILWGIAFFVCPKCCDPIGGTNFLSLMTAINLAFSGWKQLEESIEDSEKNLEAKMLASSATLSDADKKYFETMCKDHLVKDREPRTIRLRRSLRFARVGVVGGLALLYLGWTTPLNILFSFPPLYRLYSTGLADRRLLNKMKKEIKVINAAHSYNSVRSEIENFTANATESIEKTTPKSPDNKA